MKLFEGIYYFSITDVARLLGKTVSQVEAKIQMGEIPSPKHTTDQTTHPGKHVMRRMFREEEVDEIVRQQTEHAEWKRLLKARPTKR